MHGRPIALAATLLAFAPGYGYALNRSELLPAGGTQIRITQAGQLWQQLDSTYGKRMRNDEIVQDFIAAFGEKMKKKISEGRQSMESLQQFEALKLLKGEIVGINSNERFYLAAAADEAGYRTILERTAWLHRDSHDVARRRVSFQDTELVNDIFHGGATNEVNHWMARTHGTLLLSTEREWVEKSIVRLENETIVEPTAAKLSARFPLEAWIRSKLSEKEGADRIKSMALWSALGLLELEEYLLEIEIQDGNPVIDGTLSIGEPGKGLLALLDTSPEDFSDDRIIPPDATSFSYGKIDLQSFWNYVPAILTPLPTEGGAPLAGLILMIQRQAGLDIENDLLAHTGTRFTLHNEQISTNQPMLMTLELTNGKALEASLTQLLSSPLAQNWAHHVISTDYRGHTIRHMKNEKNPDTEAFALCVMDDLLLFGLKADVVRNAILRLENSTPPDRSAMHSTATRLAPDTAFGYGAMDHRKAPVYLKIKVSDSSFSAGLGISSKEGEPEEELGENEISLEHLMSYLGNTYHYAEAVPGGIHHRLVIETDKTQGIP